MALRGSLREFELSEIFQLISRDGKTGQLVLSFGEKEAFVIFFKGQIISAGNDECNLQTILFNYLILVCGYSKEELDELLVLCQGEMRVFSQELIKRNYIRKEELTTLLQNGIEDLSCSLFLWENGNYRFDSLASTEEYNVFGITSSVDAITMEAMRRSDEWKQIQKHITKEMIFTLLPQSTHSQTASTKISPLVNPSGYIASLVDGNSSVDDICKRSFLVEYRIFEILFGLYRDHHIEPLVAQTIQPEDYDKTPHEFSSKKLLHTIVTTAIILVWLSGLCFWSFVISNVVFSTKLTEQKKIQQELSSSLSLQKMKIAKLNYREETGQAPVNFNQLEEKKFLSYNDFHRTFFELLIK